MDKEKECLNSNKIIITIAVLTVLLGLFIIFRPYLQEKKDLAYDSLVSEVYDQEILASLDNVEDDSSSSTEIPEEKEEEEEEIPEKPEQVKPQNDYIGMLEISKINLNRGFVNPSSKYNDIKYNVTIINGSTFPDVDKGNFILAAHSGSGPLAIFKNLYKLKVGDKAVVTYNNKKYTYKIVKIYYQKKQGYITIYRDVNKTTLTLVTCTKNNSKSQTVYIAELI